MWRCILSFKFINYWAPLAISADTSQSCNYFPQLLFFTLRPKYSHYQPLRSLVEFLRSNVFYFWKQHMFQILLSGVVACFHMLRVQHFYCLNELMLCLSWRINQSNVSTGNVRRYISSLFAISEKNRVRVYVFTTRPFSNLSISVEREIISSPAFLFSSPMWNFTRAMGYL